MTGIIVTSIVYFNNGSRYLRIFVSGIVYQLEIVQYHHLTAL